MSEKPWWIVIGNNYFCISDYVEIQDAKILNKSLSETDLAFINFFVKP